MHSGLPFNIGDGFDQAGTGNIFAYDRPNLNPGFNKNNITTGTINEWFNPNAFSLPPVGEFGNLGRDVLTGPFFWDIDFSTIKDTKLSERFTLQFRAEFFNIFNHPDLGPPNAAIFSQLPGGGGSINPAAGQITTLANNMRQIQFALKLIF